MDSLEKFVSASRFIIGNIMQVLGLLSNLGKSPVRIHHMRAVRFDRSFWFDTYDV